MIIKLKQGCIADLKNRTVTWGVIRIETLKNALKRKEFVDELTDEEVFLINENCSLC